VKNPALSEWRDAEAGQRCFGSIMKKSAFACERDEAEAVIFRRRDFHDAGGGGIDEEEAAVREGGFKFPVRSGVATGHQDLVLGLGSGLGWRGGKLGCVQKHGGNLSEVGSASLCKFSRKSTVASREKTGWGNRGGEGGFIAWI
jgi:hypothetical protein